MVKEIKFAVELPEGIDRYEFEERAAILEYDANFPREYAEKRALKELLNEKKLTT